jgi:hypothetical protein
VLFARLHEPPCADPHAGWCGRGELNALLDPIRPRCLLEELIN